MECFINRIVRHHKITTALNNYETTLKISRQRLEVVHNSFHFRFYYCELGVPLFDVSTKKGQSQNFISKLTFSNVILRPLCYVVNSTATSKLSGTM